MARRKIQDRNIRSLNKVSNGKSYTVTIPIDVVRRWRWKNHQKLFLRTNEKKRQIIIEDWEK